MFMPMEKNISIDFEKVYIAHYSKMRRFALTYVLSEVEAENIVQDIFLDLWEKRDQQLGHLNIVAFLFTAVKNRCIDYIRHQIIIEKTSQKIQEDYTIELQMKFSSLEILEIDQEGYTEIEAMLYQAIDALPEKCKIIFIKNKLEGKKQKEIALEMNISVNTVENQIAIAYKKLKNSLKDYILLFSFLIDL